MTGTELPLISIYMFNQNMCVRHVTYYNLVKDSLSISNMALRVSTNKPKSNLNHDLDL